MNPLGRTWNTADRLFSEIFIPELFKGCRKEFNVDITEEKDVIKLKAELPGVKKENVSIELNNESLIIKAEKKEGTTTSTSQIYLRKESKYGMMQRTFSIADVNPENISASFLDGVLNITIKKETPQFKKIKIS